MRTNRRHRSETVGLRGTNNARLRRIRQVLPFELEPHLPHPVEELIFEDGRAVGAACHVEHPLAPLAVLDPALHDLDALQRAARRAVGPRCLGRQRARRDYAALSGPRSDCPGRDIPPGLVSSPVPQNCPNRLVPEGLVHQ